uniref:Tegument protein UL37 n=1 Tax=Mastomys natalensis cytomegalovirus 1 TaxID=2973541 RepID=A0A9Y1N677_9BETA|nr:tegument protein UL37 [Mastomys natalensis cytomegalovirus 1]WEG68914.1 tegument protein UL37 [Mastomys natalensis cytomegalovirus 1]WEG71142.1 tegument protein UL37 [Mastomys natalensis cytomegalovirus 1]
MALSKNYQHGIRALNLEQTLDDLRSKTTCDEELLNILAKIEISAVQLQTVTAPRIRRFLQYVPEGKYHFEFIHRNSVYYFLNHGTFAPVEKGRFPLAIDLLSELKKHVEKKSKSDTTSKLTNDRVVQTLSEFLHDVNRLPEIQKMLSSRCLIDDEPTRPQSRVKEFTDSDISAIEKMINTAEPLKNCRAVAELLQELYHAIFETFRTSMTYRNFKRDDDTKLDVVIKIIHSYENHAMTTDSESDFQKAIDRATAVLSEACSTDIYEIQQPGSEYAKDVSFKISSKSLLAKERSDLRFPVLMPSLITLKYISPSSVLFYPGVVFSILKATTQDAGTDQTNELQAFNDFCTTINDILFTQLTETKQKSIHIKDLFSRTKAFYKLGLTPKTTATYIHMLSFRSWHRHAIRPEIAEAVDHITFLTYNAHIHFLCLSQYNNTFLFYHAKRLILEQQRSALTGHKALDDVWANVAFNINHVFSLRYGEDEFLQLVSGLPSASREYLYRDAANKWDDISFSLDQEDISDPLPLPPQRDPTIEEITRACELVDGENTQSYNSLLPLSTYPEFDKILTEITIIPQFNEIINSPPSDIRAHDDVRLLKLIHICRLLMPRRMELYRSFVSLYNLLHYVSHTDIGLVKVLYSVIRAIIGHIRDITDGSYAFTSDMLEDLAIESFMNLLELDIAHALSKVHNDRTKLLKHYLKHSTVCYFLLKCKATLFIKTNIIVLSNKTYVVSKLSLPSFIEKLQKLVSDNTELENGLQFVLDADERIMERLKSFVIDIKEIPTFNDLTFNTRPIRRIYSKVNEAIQTNQTSLRILYSKRFKFNQEACGTFSPLISAYYTLHKDNIDRHGLRQCITNAVALAESRDSSQYLSPEDFEQDSITVLKKTFTDNNGSDTLIAQREMSGNVQTSVTPLDFNYDKERYDTSYSVPLLRNWYVEKTDKVQQDLITPLRLSRTISTT